MHIGYDVTVLYCANGGILRYTVSLLAALRDLIRREEIDADLALVDYAPARGPWPLRTDLAVFLDERVRLTTIAGPQPYSLRKAAWLNFRGGRRLARRLDKWTAAPQGRWINWQTRRRQRQALGALDVFHASDVVQLAPAGVAQVATVFDLSPLHWPEYHLSRNVELFKHKMAHLSKHADRIIAISQATADDLAAHYPAAAAQVDIVHCGVDAAFRPVTDRAALADVRRKYGIPAPDYLLFVGTLEPRKNLVRLVEAYAAVYATEGAATPPLVLAGSRGWHDQPIFGAVEQWQMQDHIHFTGPVAEEDLPALYSGADCFIYPSLFEGFGLPVLEAMACGAPVITSNTSSLPEVAGDAALLVPPQDVDALAGALGRLLNDAALRTELRQRGLAQAARFSWEMAARETWGVYGRARDETCNL
jgi:glycosyltransferase involved in cell wall biosynthesis